MAPKVRWSKGYHWPKWWEGKIFWDKKAPSQASTRPGFGSLFCFPAVGGMKQKQKKKFCQQGGTVMVEKQVFAQVVELWKKYWAIKSEATHARGRMLHCHVCSVLSTLHISVSYACVTACMPISSLHAALRGIPPWPSGLTLWQCVISALRSVIRTWAFVLDEHSTCW